MSCGALVYRSVNTLTFCYPERYADERGREMWTTVLDLLKQIETTHSSVTSPVLEVGNYLDGSRATRFFLCLLRGVYMKDYTCPGKGLDPTRFALAHPVILREIPTRQKPPHHKPGEEFLCGPVP